MRLKLAAALRELAGIFLTALAICAILQLGMIWSWGKTLPPSISWPAQALGLLLAAAPVSLLRLALSPRLVWALSLFTASLLAYFNHLKITYINTPVRLEDLFLLNISPVTLRYVGAAELLALLLAALVPVAALLAWRRLRGKKAVHSLTAPRAAAAFLVLVSFLFLFSGAGSSWLISKYADASPLQTAMLRDGYLLSSFLRGAAFRARFPDAGASEKILRDLPKPAKADAGNRRDIVMVLLESFDTLERSGLKLKPGFLPHYRRIKAEAVAFRVYSPVFGGVTANAEYEVLTGMSANADAQVSVPYAGAVNHPVASVVRQFGANGFTTMSILNSERDLWNREPALRHLGVQEFLSDEELATGPAANGIRSDRVSFQKSLELLEKTGRPPAFQIIDTVETHGPYSSAGVTSSPRERWLQSGGDEELASEVDDFASRMQILDAHLGEYFTALARLPRKPIVILFADHQPHFLLKLSPGGFSQALYEVDAVVWGAGRGQPPFGNKIVDLYCLGPLALRLGGVPLAPFFQFVDKFCRQDGALSRLDPKNPRDAQLGAQLRSLFLDRLWGVQKDED